MSARVDGDTIIKFAVFALPGVLSNRTPNALAIDGGGETLIPYLPTPPKPTINGQMNCALPNSPTTQTSNS